MRVCYYWINHPDGERLEEIGIADDGTLINPRGYPEERVREAISAAQAGRSEKRGGGGQNP
jgi:hypothetical protein